ncbi:SDR family NAD(P)-dependent oxidoreductase [Gluconacetobacter aggeris]|uniref:SDR family NAD(P)-dependent oxidoreductase n=1 Tax=Gluconacetobacter aggeris TaxID=1286186 RepID=A0A7W4IQW6_9PROT|nr:SDR family NAD(P)-dependent oxidoreductase [Gluconacetobacter aggeris]MBB2167394.1 SDR family NAD(P)-dependent oxidoreductase [Gluconacetobacter aggeris]
MTQIVLVTGATAGFGKAIAERLVQDGYRVIATGRRRDRLEALAGALGPALLPLVLDMDDSAALRALPASLPDGWQEVDILINNAGLALGMGKAQDSAVADWRQMIETNIAGLVEITHALLPGMVARDRGHIISIGSTAGIYPYLGGNVYGGTKAFVAQFMRNLRCDLLGTKVRATNLEPGLCGGSEFSNVRLRDDAKAAAVYQDTHPIQPEDIAETVAWVLGLPAHVNINRIEMMPTCQAAGGLAVARGLEV